MGIKQRVYVGTYSEPILFGTGEVLQGKGKGIYRFEFDPDTAALTLQGVTETANPSFLATDSEGERLYAVNELKDFGGQSSGAVSAFRIQADGSLEQINQMATQGADPCHVVVSPDRKRVIVSNYSGGSVSVFPLCGDGALGEMVQFMQYEGSSANPQRQTSPHAHSAAFSPDGGFVYVCDLGTDRVRTYRYDGIGKALSSDGVSDFMAAPGAGPRHAAFSPDGRFAYVINELDCTISVLAIDCHTGALTEIQKITTLPGGEGGEGNICAGVHITRDGRFLYGSNRGLDNIVIYRVDGASGMLLPAGFVPCGGRTPRCFTLDATGRFLLCANQDSDSIIVFSIDQDTGQLNKESETFAPTPVFIGCF